MNTGDHTGQRRLRELKQNETEVSGAKTEVSATPKQIERRKRTIEHWFKGLTEAQISKKMREEHFLTCEHTVSIDLHSTTAEEELKELKRQQFSDITLANDDYKTRLEYRDREIERLTPVRSKVEVSGTITTIINRGYDFDEIPRTKPTPETEPKPKPDCEVDPKA